MDLKKQQAFSVSWRQPQAYKNDGNFSEGRTWLEVFAPLGPAPFLETELGFLNGPELLQYRYETESTNPNQIGNQM